MTQDQTNPSTDTLNHPVNTSKEIEPRTLWIICHSERGDYSFSMLSLFTLPHIDDFSVSFGEKILVNSTADNGELVLNVCRRWKDQQIPQNV